MKKMDLETPVLFLIFNRIDTAIKVFEKIREVKPRFLFIAADGPRTTVAEDLSKCIAVRKAILDMVDWPCELKILFRESNLGCGVAPAQAITWFFEHVEEGIILEDDCLPDSTFFFFCQELLQYYRNNPRIMHIGGNNFQYGKVRGNGSYFFSIYSHIWGWATWRRSWSNYDFFMTDFDPVALIAIIERLNLSAKETEFWISHYKNFYGRRSGDIWDYQWAYAIWKSQGVSILPNKNLIMNIGFDERATHTKNATERLQSITLQPMGKIIHPEKIELATDADRFTFDHHFMHKDKLWRSFKNRLLEVSIVRKMYTLLKTH